MDHLDVVLANPACLCGRILTGGDSKEKSVCLEIETTVFRVRGISIWNRWRAELVGEHQSTYTLSRMHEMTGTILFCVRQTYLVIIRFDRACSNGRGSL